MARVIYPDGRVLTDFAAIAAQLAGLGITLQHWPAPTAARAAALLAQAALSDAEKEELLGHVEHRFEGLKTAAGYQARDLIVLHAEVPQIQEMLGKFDRIHYHDDDEVRYIVDGTGYFGFVEDTEQFQLQVSAGDYINVPARTEHWFTLDADLRIKAVRYFTGMSGWMPNYTGRAVLFG